VASRRGGQQCVCAISVHALAVLPSLLANSIQTGSPHFVMSTHLFAELDNTMQVSPRARFAPPKRLLVNFPPLSELGPPRLLLELFAPPPLHLRYPSQVSSPLFLLPPAPTTYRISPFPSISNYPAGPVPCPLLPLYTLQMCMYQVHTTCMVQLVYPACSEKLRLLRRNSD